MLVGSPTSYWSTHDLERIGEAPRRTGVISSPPSESKRGVRAVSEHKQILQLGKDRVIGSKEAGNVGKHLSIELAALIVPGVITDEKHRAGVHTIGGEDVR